MKSPSRPWVVIGALFAVAVVAVVAAVVMTARSVERIDDDTSAAREFLGLDLEETVEEPVDDDWSTFLVVGSDGADTRDGQRADVLLLLRLPPSDGGTPVIASLPRDLWVDDLCRGGKQRVNAALNGCGQDVTGTQLTLLTVEHLTGWDIDHYVQLGFEGFIEVVDAVGGTQICTEHPVRDQAAGLDLPGGCVQADADQALSWVRSRMTQEFVDGQWRTMPGVDDLSRNQRQQDLLLQVVGEVGAVRSPATLRRLAVQLSDVVAVGNSLGLDDLLALSGRAGDLQGNVIRAEIPVQHHRTSGGAAVLLPDVDLRAFFADLAAQGRGEAAGPS